MRKLLILFIFIWMTITCCSQSNYRKDDRKSKYGTFDDSWDIEQEENMRQAQSHIDFNRNPLMSRQKREAQYEMDSIDDSLYYDLGKSILNEAAYQNTFGSDKVLRQVQYQDSIDDSFDFRLLKNSTQNTPNKPVSPPQYADYYDKPESDKPSCSNANREKQMKIVHLIHRLEEYKRNLLKRKSLGCCSKLAKLKGKSGVFHINPRQERKPSYLKYQRDSSANTLKDKEPFDPYFYDFIDKD